MVMKREMNLIFFEKMKDNLNECISCNLVGEIVLLVDYT